MHVVHFPKEAKAGLIASAVGIIFDTKFSDPSISNTTVAIIDRFFDAMRLDQTNDPVVPEIPFGDLMAAIDTNNRWVYKGSLTTPPCSKLIYWNVVGKVYPIK
jgi:carbonic anhydrase